MGITNGTTVIGSLTLQQMQAEAAKRQQMADAANKTSVVERKFQFFATFDGTNNDKNKVPQGSFQTNVANLFDQAYKTSKNNINFASEYYQGIGTGGEMGDQKNAGLFPTNPAEIAANKAYADFSKAAISFLQNNPTATVADIGVAAVGFSRGSPTAIRFTQLLNERGIRDETGKVWAPPGSVAVDALGIMDPVNRFMTQNSGIPGNVRNVLQLNAIGENRADFRVLDYSADTRVTALWMLNNHCGIGGGYDENGTAANVLEGLTAYFQKSGYAIADVPANKLFDPTKPALLYTQIYQLAANGDMLTDESGQLRTQWAVDTGPRKTVLADQWKDLAQGVQQLRSDTNGDNRWDSTREAVRNDPSLYQHAEYGRFLTPLREILNSSARFASCAEIENRRGDTLLLCSLDSDSLASRSLVLLASTMNPMCQGLPFCAYFFVPMQRTAN